MRKFNDAGSCVSELHFMADTAAKLERILALIEEGSYFTINRPRQYGKTTMLDMIWRALKNRDGYVALNISFESISAGTYGSEQGFIEAFLIQLKRYARDIDDEELGGKLTQYKDINHFLDLDQVISDITRGERKVVLLIDEVDKSANNQMFLDFLALLRSKYLKRARGLDTTFQSVALAGVHDIKHLKSLIRKDDAPKFNSPWNIAIDLEVDLSLFPNEIAPMLEDYSRERGVVMDVPAVAERLFYHTSGYPFLVSRLCKIMDEKMEAASVWTPERVDRAVAVILTEKNTNFESLIKNLENNKDLYALTEKMLLQGARVEYRALNPLIEQGVTYGVFSAGTPLKIHNRIYQQQIYDHLSQNLSLKRLLGGGFEDYTFPEHYLNEDGSLNFERVLLKFQEFMKKEYSVKDEKFIEREGRLVFLAFLRPIINGHGYDFKEVQISEEKRLDVVVVFRDRKFVVELKIWKGPAAHKKGLGQLHDYLDREHLSSGFLVIFDFSKKKKRKGTSLRITEAGKDVFAVFV